MADAKLTKQVVSVMVERVQAAVESGVIDVVWEGGGKVESSVCLTDGELARLLLVLFPSEYGQYLPQFSACSHPPGSDAKIDELAERFSSGVPLFARDEMRVAGGPAPRVTPEANDREMVRWLLSTR